MSERIDANEARYDRMAPVYRWITGLGSLGTIRALYRRAAHAIEAPAGGLVVDLGCGPATLTPYLRRRLDPSTRLIGVDLSRGMVDAARRQADRRGWPNVEFVRASVHEFTPPVAADAVVFCLSLSLLPDPSGAVERALAFTRPGGRWVVVDSVPRRGRPLAAWVIRVKAGFVGAEPDAFPLALLERELEDFREQALQGGVYPLLTGQKPR